MVCLGIEVDTCQQTLRIPAEKLHLIIDKCNAILKKKSISKRTLQSVLGSLMFAHKAVKPTRVFTNRLLSELRNAKDNQLITVSDDIKRDLKWFIEFASQYNGLCKYVHDPVSVTQMIAIDACLKGLGGVFGTQVYFFDLNKVYIPQCFHITHLEMWNIVLACRIWAKYWQGKEVKILCDNEACVHVLSSGFTRDVILATMARNIWLIQACNDFKLVVEHISGVRNEVADLLSRWIDTPNNVCRLKNLVPGYNWVHVDKSMLYLDQNI